VISTSLLSQQYGGPNGLQLQLHLLLPSRADWCSDNGWNLHRNPAIFTAEFRTFPQYPKGLQKQCLYQATLESIRILSNPVQSNPSFDAV
jgi:hypothetical protein